MLNLLFLFILRARMFTCSSLEEDGESALTTEVETAGFSQTLITAASKETQRGILLMKN